VTGVTNLTTQQNIDIWTGKDTNWNQPLAARTCRSC
jgi:ABC-type phosphate transport system substrate-binding protein